ncbi:glycosyltransferase family 1 protein [Nocardioides ochotonae]|uniref:glycosyltransferase family 1 protein n=1 Tax=Nocardioides ochotonae TaxID=2685869 RepID=UPI00140ADB9B|nr:glycosyltransferase family 1 protein [Nocardioides ochotonae]
MLTPWVFPRHSGYVAKINRLILRFQLRRWIRGGGPAPKVLWLYTPVDYGLSAHAASTIYHCVDLLREVEGIDSTVIDNAEASLAAGINIHAAGSSPAVMEHLKRQGFENLSYWPNVADVETFASHSANPRRPRVIFAGNMTAAKVDFAALEDLLAVGIDLHLAGPIAEGGGSAVGAMERLVERGATYHGLLDLAALAELQSTFTVGLIPYRANKYTAGVSPLKTYEYLASGLRVVSMGVPSVRAVEGMVDAVGADEFVPRVQQVVNDLPTDETVEARLAHARVRSWVARGAEMRELVTTVTRPSSPLLGSTNSDAVADRPDIRD